MPLPFGSVAPLLQPDHLKSHGYGPEVADVLATRSTSSPSTWEKNPSTVQNTNDLGGTAALHPFHPHDILASFPGRSHLQYLIAYSMQIRRGKAWEISSRAVTSGRQKVDTRGAVPDEES